MSSVMKVDSITKSDGTAGVHIAGHVLQVVQGEVLTQITNSSNSYGDVVELEIDGFRVQDSVDGAIEKLADNLSAYAIPGAALS